MNYTPKNKRAMTKEEVTLLVDLIQNSPVLTSKETNAITNKLKEDAWASLTVTFNTKSGSMPRTQEQLKFKWDNLKKAARKRVQEINMNQLKTDGGNLDFTSHDPILERVSRILDSTSSEYVLPFGADGVGCSVELGVDSGTDAADDAYLDSNDCVDTKHHIPNVADNLPEPASKGIDNPIIEINEGSTHSKYFFGIPVSEQLASRTKGPRKPDIDGRRARNLAIARFYDKRTEKLDLEIKLLRLELAKKGHNIMNARRRCIPR